MKNLLRLTFFLFALSFSFAQQTQTSQTPTKQIVASRLEGPIRVDGVLDEGVWSQAPVANNFIERQPNKGQKEPQEHATSAKILYDDTGIYFGVQINHPNPKEISRELMERDQIGNDDFFAISLNGNNDHQQSLLFIIQASGVQADAKLLINKSDDYSWNAVWYSAIKINDQGWSLEVKIPFSELRFPKDQVQTWGLNFITNLQKKQTQYTWNPIDNTKGSFMLYDGILTGIENISPPTRLSFSPYFSTYFNKYNHSSDLNVNGGMDLKYGLNEAFTLDLTLIPDFGQANFDEAVLNLGPFEQQYDENRSFFMEGTELFGKGDLFYSRRVGGEPSGSLDLQPGEESTGTPEKVNLFNAIKLSGRTKKGLGIGLFNGVTEKLTTKAVNKTTGTSRDVVLEPWSNYNVLVLDQRFGGNSSITLVNTNVTREGHFRDANVTALLADLTNKENTHNLFGSLKQSIVNSNTYLYGTEATLGAGKIAGAHRYSFDALVRTKDYSIDDLGYTGGNNYVNYHGYYSYRYLKPRGKLNNLNYQLNVNLSSRLEPYQYRGFDIHQTFSVTNKKFETMGLGLLLTPFGEKDMYEPRTFARHLNVPSMVNPWIFYESDSRKKLSYDGYTEIYAFNQPGRIRYVTEFDLRYRVSDRFSIEYDFQTDIRLRDLGYVAKDQGEIIIGRRDVHSFENAIESQYIFNDKMALNLAFRHYLSTVKYDGFHALNTSGDLNPSGFQGNHDGSYNFWNLDLRFSWWFAPGSQLTLLYRNAADSQQAAAVNSLKDNLRHVFDQPMLNTLSLKITYYLDYNAAKQFVKKATGGTRRKLSLANPPQAKSF